MVAAGGAGGGGGNRRWRTNRAVAREEEEEERGSERGRRGEAHNATGRGGRTDSICSPLSAALVMDEEPVETAGAEGLWGEAQGGGRRGQMRRRRRRAGRGGGGPFNRQDGRGGVCANQTRIKRNIPDLPFTFCISATWRKKKCFCYNPQIPHCPSPSSLRVASSQWSAKDDGKGSPPPTFLRSLHLI